MKVSVLFTKYYSGHKVKENEIGGACCTFGRQERCIQSFVGKSEGKRPLGRHRRRLKDNIKRIFKKYDEA